MKVEQLSLEEAGYIEQASDVCFCIGILPDEIQLAPTSLPLYYRYRIYPLETGMLGATLK